MFIEKMFINRISSRYGIIDTGNNVFNCKCPICGDSKKKSNKKRFFIFYHRNKFIVKCHNCSYTNSFENFLKYIDYNLYTEFKVELLKSKNSFNLIESNINLKTNVDNKLDKTKLNILGKLTTIKETNNQKIKDYIKSRLIPENYYSELYCTSNINLISSEIEKYKNLNYQEADALVIPYFNKSKELTLIQTRYIDPNIKPRFQTFSIIDSDNVIYNEHLLDYSKVVSITEGAIDSLFIPNCTALTGATNTSRINYISTLAESGIRMIFDNDYSSNKEILKQLNYCIDKGYQVVIYDSKFKGIKDLNEAVIKKVFDISSLEVYINSRTFSGLTAKLELAKQLKR